jgi:hypothetical protein
MTLLRDFLITATLLIYSVSIYVIVTMGIDFPAVYFSDMLKLDWRTQFNTDLLIALCLFFIWVAWREGFTVKGFVFGLTFMILDFMFGCPYLLFAIYKANGDIKVLLLGIHANK